MDGDLSIHIHSICTVVPASPTRRCSLPLTSLDFLNRNVACMQRILFYSLDSDSSCTGFITRLRSSLAEALVSFYPLAGRFTNGEFEKPRIDCNGAGVPFIEAEVLNRSLSEFLGSPRASDLCSELVHVESSELADAPHVAPVSVQVTRFRSGGLAVGVAYSHLLIDGFSFWHFMKSWSETASGKSLSLLPVHSREIRTQLISNSPPDQLIIGKKAANSLPRYFAIPATPSMEVPVGFSNIQQRFFSFPAHFIRKLKLDVQASAGGDEVSSLKVICAHIWRTLIRCRGLEPSTGTRFFMAVDVRKRLVPCLPEGYFGNAVCAVFAEASAGELLNENGTAHGVRLLSRAIAGATDGNIKSLLRWCDTQGNAYFRGADYAHDDNNFVVVSSPKFPAYKIDYGWGNPVAVRPGKLPWSGVITFFEGAGGCGDVDVCICLAAEEFKRMEQLEQQLGGQHQHSFLQQHFFMGPSSATHHHQQQQQQQQQGHEEAQASCCLKDFVSSSNMLLLG